MSPQVEDQDATAPPINHTTFLSDQLVGPPRLFLILKAHSLLLLYNLMTGYLSIWYTESMIYKRA